MLDTTIKQCNECGKEYPAFLNKCTHCGCANEIKSEIKFNVFTTAWLIFSIVVAVADAAISVLCPSIFGMPEGAVAVFSANIVRCLILIAAYVMLLMHKQNGFYIAVVTELLCLPICILAESSMLMYIAIFNIILLNLFLNLKQNGRTYWDAMKIVEQQTASTVEE